MLLQPLKDKQDEFETDQKSDRHNHGGNRRLGVAVVDMQLDVDRADLQSAGQLGQRPREVGVGHAGKVTGGSSAAERERAAVGARVEPLEGGRRLLSCRSVDVTEIVVAVADLRRSGDVRTAAVLLSALDAATNRAVLCTYMKTHRHAHRERKCAENYNNNNNNDDDRLTAFDPGQPG